MCKIRADDPTIDVSPGDDPLHTQSIKRVEVTKGMRTLGVRVAPDGNDFDEFMHPMEPHSTENMFCHWIPIDMADEVKILPWSDMLL
jgi:hypothetical protein